MSCVPISFDCCDYDYETKAVNFSATMSGEAGHDHRPHSMVQVDLKITCNSHILLVEPHETDPQQKKAVASVSSKFSNSVCFKPVQFLIGGETCKILLGIVKTWPLHPGRQRIDLVHKIYDELRFYADRMSRNHNLLRVSMDVEIINTHVLHKSSVFHNILALAPERKRIEEEEEDEITDRCSICLDPFSKGNQVSILPCSHIFHCNCIEQWLVRSQYCPLFRFRMTMGVIYGCSHRDLDPRLLEILYLGECHPFD